MRNLCFWVTKEFKRLLFLRTKDSFPKAFVSQKQAYLSESSNLLTSNTCNLSQMNCGSEFRKVVKENPQNVRVFIDPTTVYGVKLNWVMP